jgi:hypothetical protein
MAAGPASETSCFIKKLDKSPKKEDLASELYTIVKAI